MRTRPSISVLMPARDAAATLDQAVRSVRAQSLESWGLIAIDDGSRDRSLAILQGHAADDGRIRVLRQ